MYSYCTCTRTLTAVSAIIYSTVADRWRNEVCRVSYTTFENDDDVCHNQAHFYTTLFGRNWDVRRNDLECGRKALKKNCIFIFRRAAHTRFVSGNGTNAAMEQ